MHLEIFVEDQSGKKALDILIPKIIGDHHTFKVTGYKGIGRIPRNLKSSAIRQKCPDDFDNLVQRLEAAVRAT